MRSLHLRAELSRASGRLRLALKPATRLHNGAEQIRSAPLYFGEYQSLNEALLKRDFNWSARVLLILISARWIPRFVND